MQHLSRHQNSLWVGFIMDLALMPNFVEIEVIQDMNKQATLWYQACSVLALTVGKEHEYYENVRLPNQKKG